MWLAQLPFKQILKKWWIVKAIRKAISGFKINKQIKQEKIHITIEGDLTWIDFDSTKLTSRITDVKVH